MIVVAAPAEAKAVLHGVGHDGSAAPANWALSELSAHLDLVVSGVGKANAAAAVVRTFDADRHGAVLNLGVAGMLPGSGLALGQAIVGERSVYADEGGVVPKTADPKGFVDIAQMGFPPALMAGVDASTAVPASPALLEVLRPLADRSGDIATVSTCSGTDDQAWAYAERTGAIAECMEGAAVGFTCAQLRTNVGPNGSGQSQSSGGASSQPPLFCELRTISNTTGDRDQQKWDLAGAMEALSAIAAEL